MSKQPLQIYDFRNPDEAFKLMKGTSNDEFKQKLHLATEMWTKWYSEYCEKEKQLADLSKKVERLQEQLESAQEVIYEYIKIYGVERECSKYLEKYAKRTK